MRRASRGNSKPDQALRRNGLRRQPPGEDVERPTQIDRFRRDEIEQQCSPLCARVDGDMATFQQQQPVDSAHVVRLQHRRMCRVQTGGAGCRDQQAAEQRPIVQLCRRDSGQFGNQVNNSYGFRRPHGTHVNPLRAFREGPEACNVTGRARRALCPSSASGSSIAASVRGSLARAGRFGVICDMATPTVFTVPNLVSSSRVVLAVGFVAFDVAWARFALICMASFTDFLDGWIARRTKVTSRFGALIDPVADRFFVLAVVGTYVAGGQLTWWQAVAIMFRDVMSVIGFFVARNVSWLRPITFKARLVGKAVTVVQLATFLAVLVVPSVADGLVLVVAALGLIATIDYTLMLWRERTRAPAAPLP